MTITTHFAEGFVTGMAFCVVLMFAVIGLVFATKGD